MIIGIAAFVELRSFMKSTHKVEFVPLSNQESKQPTFDDELEKFGI
jgi:hypothetical protein